MARRAPAAEAPQKEREARTLRLTRRFAAPVELVFRAWTDPEILSRWFGPKGFTVPDCALDARPGGAWHAVMLSPEGNEHRVGGVFTEVTPPRRLAFTWAWETDGARGHETEVTVELRAIGGETELTLTQRVFESVESRNGHEGGWTSSFDCLAETLAGEAAR